MPRIKPESMFHTPEDWTELMNWIEPHNSNERDNLIMAVVMVWNLVAKSTNSLRGLQMAGPFDHIKFEATDAFNIGLPRSECPYKEGAIRDIWLQEWDRCHEDRKIRPPVSTEPANRQNNRNGPND